jgi:hypothetical protein
LSNGIDKTAARYRYRTLSGNSTQAQEQGTNFTFEIRHAEERFGESLAMGAWQTDNKPRKYPAKAILMGCVLTWVCKHRVPPGFLVVEKG